jgi:hypothetical protein
VEAGPLAHRWQPCRRRGRRDRPGRLVPRREPLPETLKYLPADSAVVIEIGPSCRATSASTSATSWPTSGFDDQSTLDEKIDEVLERITRESTFGEVDYATQVKPLLAGPMACR